MDRLLDPEDNDLSRKVARATLVTRALILGAIVVGVACLVVLLQLASSTNQIANQVNDRQTSNTSLLHAVQDNQSIIKALAVDIRSCTDPSGECAKRGQRNQAKALGLIKTDTRDVVAASLACQQQGVEGFNAITACVDGLLARQVRDAP